MKYIVSRYMVTDDVKTCVQTFGPFDKERAEKKRAELETTFALFGFQFEVREVSVNSVEPNNGLTVGDLVANGTFVASETLNAEEKPTHRYNPESRKIEAIEPIGSGRHQGK